MITVRKTFNIQVENAPFTFTLTPSSECVTVKTVSTSTTQVVVDVIFLNEECASNATFTATVVDNSGCILSTAVSISSPCDTFAVTDISVDSELTFSVVASGGVAPYTYLWQVDTLVFSVNSLTGASLPIVELLSTPASTTVYCTVTDSAGCEVIKTLEYSFCKPTASNATVTMIPKYADGISSSACPGACSVGFQELARLVTECAAEIDWSKTVFNTTDPNLCLFVSSTGLLTAYSKYTEADSLSFTYYVVDDNGLQSDPATLTLAMGDCSVAALPKYLSVAGEIQRVSASADTGDILTFDVLGRIHTSSDIDWDTFEFLNTPAMGTVSLAVPGVIEYEITTAMPASGADAIIWYVANEEGIGSGSIADVVVYDLLPAPVANTDYVCVACTELSDPVDILDNDTGDIDPASVQFLSIDPDIQISGVNGVYRFKAGYGASLSNIITYKVSNKDGVQSNTAGIVVRSVCAGVISQSVIDATCNREIDLGDYVTNHNSFTYTVEEPDSAEAGSYTDQGGVIDTAFPCTYACLDFTAISAGDYVFTLTAESQTPCSNTDSLSFTVHVENVPYPPNDNCAGAYTMPYSNNMYLNGTNADQCPRYFSPTDSGVSVPSSWVTPAAGDLWYTFTVNDASNLTPYIYIQGITMANPQVALYNGDCNTLVELADAAVVGTTVTLTSADYTTLVNGTQYWLRVSCPEGDEGTYRVIVSKTAIA